MTEIPVSALEEVRQQYHAMRTREAKKKVIDDAALHFGVSYATMHRRLDLRLRKRSLPKTVQQRLEELDVYGRAVWEFQQAMSKGEKKISTRAAFRCLQSTGQLPGWVTEKMCYDAIERQNFKNLAVHTHIRFEREHAHSMFQIDFTVSNWLRVIQSTGEILVSGDGYTRKQDDLRLWIGAAIDDASRVSYAEYIITPGENSTITQQFIVSTLQEKPGMMLLQGMPREIYVDRGPGFQSGPTQDGLMRLGIKHIRGEDFKNAQGMPTGEANKQARGKVEALNKYLISGFEAEALLKYRPGHRMSLADLNGQLHEWLETYNQQEHPTRENQGKWNIFNESLKTCAFPPENALAKFSKAKIVGVDRRMVRFAKDEYYMVPAFVDEGERVELSKRQTDCFMIYRGTEIKLVPQQRKVERSVSSSIGHADRIASALDELSDAYEGLSLKDRFDKELRQVSNGELNLQSLNDVQYTGLADFFAERRDLRSVKTKVAELLEELTQPAGRSLVHSKIIHYNHKAYEAGSV